MKINKLFKLGMMAALLASVFGLRASSSYAQEGSDVEDTMQANPIHPNVFCGAYCNAQKGYKIGETILLTKPGTSTNYSNIALGYEALLSDTYGTYNTASGYQSLYNNTSGSNNTASGYQALFNNTTGFGNTASGNNALLHNTFGYENTASGAYALAASTGSYNTANGYEALYRDSTGYDNTASGFGALLSNNTGNNDTALGIDACMNLITGSNVICIGAGSGPAGDIPGPATYIAGIYGAATTGSNNPLVCVDSSGLVGTTGCASMGKLQAQQEVIGRQQLQIEELQRQNEEFQQRLSRLETLVARK